MTNKNDDKKDEVSQTPATLSDDDIKTERLTGRRSFLRKLGVGLLGITAIGASQTISRARAADSDENDSGGDSDDQDGGGEPPTHHDFPKKENDGDETSNADLKNTDSDSNDSKYTDSDESRLRDAKGSSDSD
ncbi:MAG: hypothetical protein Q7S99_15835 [Parvibaculum sp.]|nr:hypothetical protein [Parvibaculum sp.]